MTVRVFGVRHHGPGSARSLVRSLDAWEPEVVLVEGPPEADAVLHLAASGSMRPPVALLGYLPARPSSSAFYPLASWSPEWVAIQHALSRGLPLFMIDLPIAAMLDPARPIDRSSPQAALPSPPRRDDPIGRLAEVAGYDDPERWWEDIIEHRGDEEPWDAITEAMAELRSGPEDNGRAGDDLEAQREASMRQHIRAADKKFSKVAVICGAWHAPALIERGPAKADAALLVGLTKEKAAVTWVPWTNTRLAFSSGYGAGVQSPGWYEHLFASTDRPVERWMIKVASLLRAEQIDAPPASVVEAVRLAHSLAALRGRPLPGLSECTDATRAVLAGGYDTALSLIGQRLVVGDAIGEVPPDTPMVALAADLVALQRRLRLRPETSVRALELDLRKETDLARSQLLYRLGLLAIPWGTADGSIRGTGTFRETWSLAWQPELAVRVIEAGTYGTTVETAATARAIEQAGQARTVGEVTALIERCLLADLPLSVPTALSALDQSAAVTSDIAELMDALPPLARVLRYGTVRRTDADGLRPIVRSLVARVAVSLVPACASLDDEAAVAMTARVSAVSAALVPLGDKDLRDGWFDALAQLSASTALHGLLAGRSSRILLDAGRAPASEVARRLGLALSRAEDPGRGAAWVEGLVTGSGLLLVHDHALMEIIDQWLAFVSEAAFDDVLPLLRRAFAAFEPGERRLIGQAAVRKGQGGARGEYGGAPFGHVDESRAAAALPLLQLLLGPEPHDGSGPHEGDVSP